MARINGITIVVEHNGVVLGIVDDMRSPNGVAYVIAARAYAYAHHFDTVEPMRDYADAHRTFCQRSLYDAT